MNAEPPDIRQFNANVPDDLQYILDRMLRKRPDERYQTPLELLRDLLNPEQIVSDMPRLLPLDDPPSPPPPKKLVEWISNPSPSARDGLETRPTVGQRTTPVPLESEEPQAAEEREARRP